MIDRMDHAGKYLIDYETSRYTWLERNLIFLDRVRSIVVSPDAEEYADVSFYQAGMDWDVYAAQARAVFLRIGQGSWQDTEFDTNYAQARLHELLVGGYAFYDGRTSPQLQATMIINAMRGRYFDMELIVDWERSYNGAHEGLQNVVRLMRLLEAAGISCKAVGIYTGYYWFTGNSSPVVHATEYAYLKGHPLWIAWYAAASLVRIPEPWTSWTHWQYGTPAVFWGQPTAEIDMNKFNGTRMEFAKRYGADETIPPSNGGSMSYSKVNTGVLNVRTGPGAAYADIGDLITGDHLEVKEVTGGWARLASAFRGGWTGAPVTLANGVLLSTRAAQTNDVWCSASYLVAVSGPSTPPPPGHVVEVFIDGESVFRRELS
jgi:lysozyme